MNKYLKTFLILSFVLSLSIPASANSSAQQCRQQILQLGSHLQIMLRKINIMPPIAQIYTPLKRTFDEAIRAQSRGDYVTCINKTNIALKYSRAYAR